MRFSVCLLILFCCALLAYGQQSFQLAYLAQQVNEYCNIREGGDTSASQVHTTQMARIGKAGPAGPPGPRGKPGVINYEIISIMIQEKFEALEDEISSLKTNMALYNKLVGALCPVKYKDRCYWVIKHSVTAIEGRMLCKIIGGEAAHIRDATHFNMVIKYLIPVIQREGEGFWTGMDYERQPPARLVLSDKTNATYVRWASRYPTRISERTAVLFKVYSNPESRSVGMWDFYPDKVVNGILCEI
ncbi:uncharacterized protein LOC120329978 [Styela clava]|uniref:uncharacterized protein LOC120329978 n=1 Tax=Styela clava TaxID=7725 RepID=UPI00193AD386|nr:uncharacterized protein LOC120329978 [Styela clava]